MNNTTLDDYLSPTEQPVASPQAELDGCGRALLPMDDALMCVNTHQGSIYTTVVVKEYVTEGWIIIWLNEKARDMLKQGDLPRPPVCILMQSSKLIRLPGEPRLRTLMLDRALAMNLQKVGF